MRKTAGFTLIELVIVIVILGILGAVAAPKFLNLQGDAYGANLNALKSSMESAVTIGNTKAILGGFDKTDAIDDKDVGDVEDVDFVYGYPAATEDGIVKLLDIKSSEYAFTTDASAATTTLVINPTSRKEIDDCKVTYSETTNSGVRPVIAVSKDGC